MNMNEAAQARRHKMQRLQSKRRDLVLAAEKVVLDRFARGRLFKPGKSQFSNLIGICNEAQCAEEIANYLRYQAGRKEWDPDFALAVIKGIQPVQDALTHEAAEGAAPSATEHPDDSAVRVGAWKLYSTYLMRAYVYSNSAMSGGRS